ncbi:MAG: hypothetical protein GY832_34605 [Chloroflexi bacterium]|nr:hypothetical protein [Chloroflexota bacterium]
MNETRASTPTGDILCVVVCGASLFLSVVAGSLRPLPELQVFQLNLRFPATLAYVVGMAPDAVIIDRDDDDGGLVRALLKHGLPLIEVDASKSAVTILSGRQVQVSETSDLVDAIRRMAVIE